MTNTSKRQRRRYMEAHYSWRSASARTRDGKRERQREKEGNKKKKIFPIIDWRALGGAQQRRAIKRFCVVMLYDYYTVSVAYSIVL